MTAGTGSGNALPGARVRLTRGAAGLAEASGTPGLHLCPGQDEIVIQVPQALCGAATPPRAAPRLAALTGGTAAPGPRPGPAQGWIRAAGVFAGHPVRTCTAIATEETPS
jgi:hypothetical protein